MSVDLSSAPTVHNALIAGLRPARARAKLLRTLGVAIARDELTRPRA